MDRSAIFVDAGYVLAEGGSLCCGTKSRGAVVCNYATLVPSLITMAQSHGGGLPVLRLYWYDAAHNAVPTYDHLNIANLPNVKVRLGRLTGKHQKGVDSLILRDLMTLARERAMAIAYVVGGDEDLREGIVAAQDMGVRVVVIGIPTPQPNQAATLIQEADENIMPDLAFWSPHFSSAAAPAAAPGPTPAPTPTAPTTPSTTPTIPTMTPTQAPAPTQHVITSTDPFQAGVEFALAWARRATPGVIRGLLGQAPRIPVQLDAQLLRETEQTLGPLRDRQDLKKSLRAGFWSGIRQAAATSSGGTQQ